MTEGKNFPKPAPQNGQPGDGKLELPDDFASKFQKSLAAFVEYVRNDQKLTRELSDPVFALLGAAGLEELLETAIESHFANAVKGIFGDRGAVSTLFHKTEIAFALGVVDADTRRRLSTVRNIRNEFAHMRRQLTFESKEIQDLMSEWPKADRNAKGFTAMCKGLEKFIKPKPPSAPPLPE